MVLCQKCSCSRSVFEPVEDIGSRLRRAAPYTNTYSTSFGRKRTGVLRSTQPGGQSPRYQNKNITLLLTKYSCLGIY